MKIGFDLGGSLSHHKWLREMARYVFDSTPHEVHVVTLISEGEQDEVYRKLQELEVPYNKVHFCIANGMSLYDRGNLKAAVMKRHEIEILFDDVYGIVERVNKLGLVGIVV